MDNEQSTSKRKAEKASASVVAVTSSSSSKKQRRISRGDVIGTSSGVTNTIVPSAFGNVFDDKPFLLAKTLLLPLLDPASATRFGMTCRTYRRVVKEFRQEVDDHQRNKRRVLLVTITETSPHQEHIGICGGLGTLYWQKVIPTKMEYSRNPEDLPEDTKYYVYQKNHYATFFREEETKVVTVILMSFYTFAWAISPRGKVQHGVPSVFDMVLDEIHIVRPDASRSTLSEQWEHRASLLELYATQSYMTLLGTEMDSFNDEGASVSPFQCAFMDWVLPSISKSVALIRHPNFDMKRSFLEHLPVHMAKGITAMIQKSHPPISSCCLDVVVPIASNFNGSDSPSDDDSSFSPSVDDDDSYEDHQLYQNRTIKVYYPPPSSEDVDPPPSSDDDEASDTMLDRSPEEINDNNINPSEEEDDDPAPSSDDDESSNDRSVEDTDDNNDNHPEEEEDDEIYESCDDEDGINHNEGVPEEDICVNYEEECDSFYSETDSLVVDADLQHDDSPPTNNTILEFSYVPPRSNTDQSPYDFVPPLGDSEYDPNDRFSETGRWYTYQILG